MSTSTATSGSRRLEIRNIGSTGKTFIGAVFSGEMALGAIKWYAPWRRYCFYPADQTIFDRGCLVEICDMLDNWMAQRKNGGKL